MEKEVALAAEKENSIKGIVTARVFDDTGPPRNQHSLRSINYDCPYAGVALVSPSDGEQGAKCLQEANVAQQEEQPKQTESQKSEEEDQGEQWLSVETWSLRESHYSERIISSFITLSRGSAAEIN